MHVLDMGTGSGLLAMMAAQAGADRCVLLLHAVLSCCGCLMLC